MPERQSTPGGTTAEQDAEAPARGSAADNASSHQDERTALIVFNQPGLLWARDVLYTPSYIKLGTHMS